MLDLKRWLMAGFLAFGMTGCGHEFGGEAAVAPETDLRLASETATTKPWGSETTETNSSTVMPVKSADSATASTLTAVSPAAPNASVSMLAQTAAMLAPGQSVKLPTRLTGAGTIYGSEGETFIQWADSGYYDPIRREIGFVGKIAGSGAAPYHWLVYDESSNTWSNSREVWSTANSTGHGYDHNTIDPATGTVYHREFGDNKVHVWNGSWSDTPSWSQDTTIVGGLSWFPGVGLMYNDGKRLMRYSGGAWSQVAYFGGDSYHDFSEYNPTANVLIFGGGESSPLRKMTAALEVSTLAAPPFTLGASKGKSVTVSDPNSATIIAYKKGTTTWAKYDISTDTWSSLTQCSGDGSSPANGTPNLVGDVERFPIGIAIPQYGVMMFIQYRGASTPADVWLYRHS